MRIAVAGGGNVGHFVAKDLAQRDHEVVVIEQNETLVEKLRKELDVN